MEGMNSQMHGNTYGGNMKYDSIPINTRQPVSAAPPPKPQTLQNSFTLDSDRLLILLMIFLLARNGADMPLILALVYLLT